MQSYAAELIRDIYLSFAKFEPWRGVFEQYGDDICIFLKWCILNVPFCSIFVPFQFYLVMILVADKYSAVFWISKLTRNGATKPIFLDSGSPKGGGGGGGSCVGGCG